MKFKSYHDYVAISLFFTICVIGVFIYFFQLGLFDIPACIFFTKFGFYCPACGGTRAFVYLLNIDLFKSLYYNPIVIFTVISVIGYFGIYVISKLKDGNDDILNKYSKICFYTFIFILISNFIFRNVLLHMYNIRI